MVGQEVSRFLSLVETPMDQYPTITRRDGVLTDSIAIGVATGQLCLVSIRPCHPWLWKARSEASVYLLSCGERERPLSQSLLSGFQIVRGLLPPQEASVENLTDINHDFNVSQVILIDRRRGRPLCHAGP
jgi:hypothetical protein